MDDQERLVELLRTRYETTGDTLARQAADEIEFLRWHSDLCREDARRFYREPHPKDTSK